MSSFLAKSIVMICKVITVSGGIPYKSTNPELNNNKELV